MWHNLWQLLPWIWSHFVVLACNKQLKLTSTFGVTKFVTNIAMNLVTLCCADIDVRQTSLKLPPLRKFLSSHLRWWKIRFVYLFFRFYIFSSFSSVSRKGCLFKVSRYALHRADISPIKLFTVVINFAPK